MFKSPEAGRKVAYSEVVKGGDEGSASALVGVVSKSRHFSLLSVCLRSVAVLLFPTGRLVGPRTRRSLAPSPPAVGALLAKAGRLVVICQWCPVNLCLLW